MAYQNYNRSNYGWRCPSDEYQVEYDLPVEIKHHHRNHHNGNRVAFRTTNYEDPIAEVVETNVGDQEQSYESTRFGNHNAFESVDQEAEAFIQHEHKRMELSRLMSTRGV